MSERINPYAVAPQLLDELIRYARTVQAMGLEKSLLSLVEIRASQINGCAVCLHMHAQEARRQGESEDRVLMLDAWHETNLYTPREKAALAWTEALTRLTDSRAPDEAYEAAKAEFTDEFVSSDACQDMQGRISTSFDQAIEDMGWDRIRSRVEVVTRDGRKLERWADEAYRGGPHNPLSDAELETKFRDCAAGLLDEARSQRVFDDVWALETLPDVAVLFDRLSWRTA